MTSRRDFITSLFRYLVAGLLVLLAALILGKKTVPEAQGNPCKINSKCGRCAKSSNCPYLQSQQTGK